MKRETNPYVKGSISKVREVKEYYPESYHGTTKSGNAINIQIASPENQENFISDHTPEKVKARIWITNYETQKARCYTLTGSGWYYQDNGNMSPSYYEDENTYSWDLLPPRKASDEEIEKLKQEIGNE